MDVKPLVSICCITYNHELFIRQCLDGLIAQQTDFPFEILVHDDASTDRTQDIIKEYEAKYPEVIKPVLQTQNQYSKGVRGINLHFNFPRAKGQYIALCEGDDYWTDPRKLQRQIDFLEHHADYVLTCGGFTKVHDGVGESVMVSGLVSKDLEDEKGFKFTLEDLSKRWITKTLTCVFRNDSDLFNQLLNYTYIRDIHLFYHMLKEGPGYYFKQLFGVYNIHGGGIFSSTAATDRFNTHCLIYRELYEVNRDEFSRQMYFKVLLDIISFNRSNTSGSAFKTNKTAFQAIRLAKTGREIFNFLKAFIPKQRVQAVKRALNR